MSRRCEHPNHIWTVESGDDYLAPCLDLVPGRRCRCGDKVITNIIDRTSRKPLFLVASIDSPTASHFAKAHPELKTW